MASGGEAGTTAEDGLFVVRGIVTTSAGAPVGDARVALAAGPRALTDVAALTGADGTFAFGALPAGRYRVEAFHDARQAFADVDLGADPAVEAVVLVLE